MVKNWRLLVAFGGCSRAGRAAALRIPSGVDQERSGPPEYLSARNELVEPGSAGSAQGEKSNTSP